MNGTGLDAYNARDILYTIARLNGLNGLASSKFQSAGRSEGSAHALLYACSQKCAFGGAAAGKTLQSAKLVNWKKH